MPHALWPLISSSTQTSPVLFPNPTAFETHPATTNSVENHQKNRKSPISDCFSWADDTSAFPMSPTLCQPPCGLSSLRSSTTNPFSSLCHRHCNYKNSHCFITLCHQSCSRHTFRKFFFIHHLKHYVIPHSCKYWLHWTGIRTCVLLTSTKPYKHSVGFNSKVGCNFHWSLTFYFSFTLFFFFKLSFLYCCHTLSCTCIIRYPTFPDSYLFLLVCFLFLFFLCHNDKDIVKRRGQDRTVGRDLQFMWPGRQTL